MSHVFISYSTKNADYAYKLADKLRDEGFNVWIDNAELRASDNWWESIVRALRAADAFIVIMTPESRASNWVQREVALADKWKKPSFPLLLEGEEFEIYVLTQFKNVKDGSLPQESFYEDLARFAKREKRQGVIVTEEKNIQKIDDSKIREALVNAPEPEIQTTSLAPSVGYSVPSSEQIIRKPSYVSGIIEREKQRQQGRNEMRRLFLIAALGTLICMIVLVTSFWFNLFNTIPEVTETPQAEETQVVDTPIVTEETLSLSNWSYDVSGDSLFVELTWRTEAIIDIPYVVSVRITDDSGKLLSQNDREPIPPMTLWRIGQSYRDTYELSIADVADGNYPLRVAIYVVDLGTGIIENLLPESGDYWLNQTISISRNE